MSGLLRRSPHLVSFWTGGRSILLNYATGVRIPNQPLVTTILTFFDDWRSRRDLYAANPSLPRRGAAEVLDALVARTMLQTRRRVGDAERAMDTWEAWNPAAGFFHHETRDLSYIAADAHARVLMEKRNGIPPPPAIKRVRGAPQIQLPQPASDDPFIRVLRARRTWRHFSRARVSLADAGALLQLTGGVQRWASTANGRAPLKTSPSGGATHPGELYAVALNVEGVPRGLYHYRADVNALELVRAGATPADIERYLPTQWWYRRAALVIFFSAVVNRSVWRYSYARAYRALLIEAGHQCQTFCLTATALGLAPFCCMALADSLIEQDFGLDGIKETVLYAAGVGGKPAGVDWAPSPPDEAWPGGPPLSRVKRRRRRS